MPFPASEKGLVEPPPPKAVHVYEHVNDHVFVDVDVNGF
jgi:hypothetical protein